MSHLYYQMIQNNKKDKQAIKQKDAEIAWLREDIGKVKNALAKYNTTSNNNQGNTLSYDDLQQKYNNL